jgi:hypothetical protein
VALRFRKHWIRNVGNKRAGGGRRTHDHHSTISAEDFSVEDVVENIFDGPANCGSAIDGFSDSVLGRFSFQRESVEEEFLEFTFAHNCPSRFLDG